jgi:hypothetical protein
MRNRFVSRFIAAAVFGGILTSYVVPAAATESNKWRIECNHNAHSDGDVVFRVHPKGGEPIDVTVKIAKGTSENAVAKAISAAFKARLPSDGYHVEVDDGEDVLVKKKMGAANFNLMLVSTTVENVKFHIEKE